MTFTQALDNHKAIQNRMHKSREKLGAIRHAAIESTALANKKLSVFAAGSLGRLESGDKSDFDVFMIGNSRLGEVSRLEEYEVFASLIAVNQKLNYPKFSGDGRFLKVYDLDEMIKATGSPRDDSENLFTARMLLLLESQPVTNEDLYVTSVEQVISNYFRDGAGHQDFRPLFLLNDILRYWRTLCLNYEEYRNEQERPWLKKNLNLKFSRKLTIFSTVLGLLAGLGNDPNSFSKLCKFTPIERLALSLDNIDDTKLKEGFIALLDDYEMFLKAKEESKVEDETSDYMKNRLNSGANRFNTFFHSAIESPRVDGMLRRYVLI